MSELPKTYDPKSVEDKLYKFWVDSGFFHAEVNPDKKPYTIVIPPPNVTGQLHMGHAFDETLQDILIRTKRMQGYEALWMPPPAKRLGEPERTVTDRIRTGTGRRIDGRGSSGLRAGGRVGGLVRAGAVRRRTRR